MGKKKEKEVFEENKQVFIYVSIPKKIILNHF
jgi:hypothetical protein